MKPLKTKRYGTGKHFKRIYLVAPQHPENFWSMQGMVDILGAMIKTWKIDPKFMRRYFTLITQFSHFYHFVNKKRK